MKPFEIYSWQPPGWSVAHPVVIVSHPDRAARKDVVEILACSSQRAGRPALATEVMLDQEDGLSWPTLCKCDLIYAAPRGELTNRRGEVTDQRRAHLVRTMIEAHGWAAVL